MELKNIPKKFTLGAIEWEIKFDDEFVQKESSFGICSLTDSEIKLTKSLNGSNLKPEVIEQSLYHELTHAILDTLGEYELSKNEEFVQKFSLLLHQFEKTKK